VHDNILVSIIIATKGRPEALKSTLNSLFSAGSRKKDCEVLVVENGRKAGVQELLRTVEPGQSKIRYLHEPATGKSRALNLGVSHARGKALLFTDDDIRFPGNWVEEMSAPLRETKRTVVVGGCRLAPHLKRPWMEYYHGGFLGSTEYLSNEQPSEFAGGNWGCTRDVFDEVLGFDVELGGGGIGNGEDALLGRQLRRHGFRFVSRTGLIVEHHPSEDKLTYEGWIQAASAAGRGQAYVLHHWQHSCKYLPQLQLLYFRAKLALRLKGKRSINTFGEGIPAWELSYRVSVALLEQYMIERQRPRNYERFGLRKIYGAGVCK
jgi:GT2 family glycosyltransferase